MRVAVLGASGLIGGAVARRLAAAGHSVMALTRRKGSAPAGTEELVGDLQAPETWAPAFARANAVIHCACLWGGDMAAVDRGLLATLRQAGFAGRVVYTGGVWLYGPNPGAPLDVHLPPNPPEPFDWAEIGFAAFRAAFDTVCVHPALVWSETAPVPGPLLAPGTQRWPLVADTDLAEGYRLALERAAPGAEVLFAAETLPVAEIAAAADLPLAAAEPDSPYGWDQRAEPTPGAMALGWRPMAPSLVDVLQARSP